MCEEQPYYSVAECPWCGRTARLSWWRPVCDDESRGYDGCTWEKRRGPAQYDARGEKVNRSQFGIAALKDICDDGEESNRNNPERTLHPVPGVADPTIGLEEQARQADRATTLVPMRDNTGATIYAPRHIWI
jgi:hypothetical protein